MSLQRAKDGGDHGWFQRTGKKRQTPHIFWEEDLGNPSASPQSLERSLSKSSQKDKKVIGNSQHGFTGDESCCAILIAFSNEMTSCADKRRAGDGAHPEFKAFDADSHSILIAILTGHRLDKVGGKLSGLPGCDQQYKPNRWPVPNGNLSVSDAGLKIPLNIFTSNLGWWSGVHFQQVCRRHQTGESNRRQGWYSEEPQQSGERG